MMLSKRTSFAILVGLCALLHFAQVFVQRVTPAHRDVGARIEGSVTEGEGWHPGKPFVTARPVRAWGTWTGSDENTGRIVLGPVAAEAYLRIGVSGYPRQPGIQFYAERTDTAEQVVIAAPDVQEEWRVVEQRLPEAWRGKPISIVAVDNAKQWAGWIGISEPVRGHQGLPLAVLFEALSAWAINGAIIGLFAFVAAAWIPAFLRRLSPQGDSNHSPNSADSPAAWCSAHWMPLLAIAAAAVAGYGMFWVFFAHAAVGKLVSFGLLLGGVAALWRAPAVTANIAIEAASVARLAVVIGLFYLALLHLFPSSLHFYHLAANRFHENLPSDNELPYDLAARLMEGLPARQVASDWLSSDRPPLQTGWLLLTLPLLTALKYDPLVASGTAAIWLQLAWVAAVFGLLRTLGVSRRRSEGWIVALALAGFFLQHTVFTWPKMAAGAFACGTFAFWILRPPEKRSRSSILVGAGLAALAWLAHGGVAFSFLVLVPWVLWRCWRGEVRNWLWAGLLFGAFAGPWLAYQKFYDPPGNRLLKWHLGGHPPKDTRGVWQTIRENYADSTWTQIYERKKLNFIAQITGNWAGLFEASSEGVKERRREEFFFLGRAMTWWVAALGILPWAWRRWSRDPTFAATRRMHFALAAWVLLTVPLWCLLLFEVGATIHQGSYAVVMVCFVLFSVWLERHGRAWLAAIALAQTFTFLTTWAVGTDRIGGHANQAALVFLIGAALALYVMLGRALLERDETPSTGPTHPTALLESGTSPRIGWFVLASALLLLLRKPWALLAPQFWAEDGEIFMNQDDAIGAEAILHPYNGYLHLLPRLIAFIASRTADVAWWPAIYNGLAFALSVGVFARLASPRVELPGKKWLLLACVVVVGTGEVPINVTNLQWVTALLLLLQLFTRRPGTTVERIGDLAILAIVGLNGPFALVFLPLFAWQAWRNKTLDTWIAFSTVAACALVQGWLVTHSDSTGLVLQQGPSSSRVSMLSSVIGSRLVVWPFFGPEAVRAWPIAVHAAVGLVVLVPLLALALRPHPLRAIRVQIAVAFCLVTLACAYRIRPGTWSVDNMLNGDRYFYLSRVLLLWLLILEFDAKRAWLRHAARALCAIGVVVNLPYFTLPAPKDYRWAEHCDPIRRGAPAHIYTLPEGWFIDYRGRPSNP